jgi:hypothetical protein
MSLRRFLSLPVPALIISIAIAVSAQTPPAITSDSASDPTVLTSVHHRDGLREAAARNHHHENPNREDELRGQIS